ncbi:hypothetical protein FKM82_013714 [Ascaphus truei]
MRGGGTSGTEVVKITPCCLKQKKKTFIYLNSTKESDVCINHETTYPNIFKVNLFVLFCFDPIFHFILLSGVDSLPKKRLIVQ